MKSDARTGRASLVTVPSAWTTLVAAVVVDSPLVGASDKHISAVFSIARAPGHGTERGRGEREKGNDG
jgi:hypothetical protein